MAKFKMKQLKSGMLITLYEVRFECDRSKMGTGEWLVRFGTSSHPKSMWRKMHFDKSGRAYFVEEGERQYIDTFHYKLRKPAA